MDSFRLRKQVKKVVQLIIKITIRVDRVTVKDFRNRIAKKTTVILQTR